MMKRLLDLIISIILGLALLPLMIVVAVLVKHELGGPVVFRQLRPGLHGTPFYVYKFRTMSDQKDSNGRLLPDYIRLTPLGKFLRKYSLDELLQLFNVIKGELSLVGPRPLLMEYLPLYSEEQSKRHNVKPGITGWAQVNGRNAVSWEERFRLDQWYVENRSFWLDCRILLLTLKKVIRSEGVSSANHVTMPMFRGNIRNQ